MTIADDNKTPDQIRADIEETRSNLGTDVDALADKVSPSSIAHRQTEKVKIRLGSVRDSVMGVAHSGTDSISGVGSNAATSVKGNAVAVGLVVFGLGLLASSPIPASEEVKAAASDLTEKAAPAIDAVKVAAKETAQNLKDPAQDAVAAVKESAQDAAGSVKDQMQSSAENVKDAAQQ